MAEAKAVWTPEIAFDEFKKLRDVIAAAEGANEATTRLRAIDKIVFDVLRWNELNVETEKYCRLDGFADYVFSDCGGVCLVLEAKKEGLTFVLPANKFPPKPVGFALLAKECQEADNALRQAIGYALNLGARYVAISNGFQWLLTLTFVPNQKVDDRSVLVFESLTAIEDRFRLFFDSFGPAGIESNSVTSALLEERIAPPPEKLSLHIKNYPAPAGRNEIANQLSAVLGAVWEETGHHEGQKTFLENCYVEPETNASALALAHELLSQRLTADQLAFSKSIKGPGTASVITDMPPEKPIVLVGNVGTGKTTFLHYLRMIKAEQVLQKYIQIDVDFIDRPDDAAGVPAFIYSTVEEQLRNRHKIEIEDDGFVRAALNADLNRFRRSPEGKAYPEGSDEFKREELGLLKSLRADRHLFLQKAFAHIRGARQFSVAIFLDNLDRRLPPIQEQAYLNASAMARDWSALVFVCLRPSTFYRSKAFGVLDSVAPKIISITPASSVPVLVRRLRYSIQYAEGKELPIPSGRAPFSSRFSMELPSVASVPTASPIPFGVTPGWLTL